MKIDQILNEIYPLPPETCAEICKYIKEVQFEKGHILLKADKVERHLYFIKKGMVRAFAPQGDDDITFWFGEEGETILSMKSYVENKKSYENIELLENCELYELKVEYLRELYKKDIHIANWGRRLAERELLKIEERIISRELLSAKQRYDELLKNKPSLLQRVQLKFIASYLGITPVSLSRIRKEK
jgi:CRP-like cAMP-binding protein